VIQALRKVDEALNRALFALWSSAFLRKNDWERVQLGGLLLHVQGYTLRWTVVFLVQWWLFPHWLIGSSSGIQTLFQVVPPTIVAVIVLVLGSVFAIGQVALSSYGSRAAILLVGDPRLQGLVVRPFLLLVVSLLLSGLTPATEPSAALAAGATTIVLATLAAIAGTLVTLPERFAAYTAPRNFTLIAMEGVADYLSGGFVAPVLFRIPLLGEMLRACLRRGDSVGLIAGLAGLETIQLAYNNALDAGANIAEYPLPDGRVRRNWFTDEFTLAHVAAGEEAVRLTAPANESDKISEFLASAAITFIKSNRPAEAKPLVDGLLKLSVTVNQVAAGTVNLYAAPGAALANVEMAAEEAGLGEFSSYCLAAWALAMSYPQFHYGAPQHPLWNVGVASLGPNPGWDRAREILQSEDWQRTWATRQYLGPEPIEASLTLAEEEHPRR
jgi:hypothetical protein